MDNEERQPIAGIVVGQFEIKDEIGRGGMGTVYRARQVSLNRDVAVKVLSPEQALDERQLERFRREGETVAGIAHPNIVQVLDIGEDAGRHFIAMELVAGRSLDAILHAEGPRDFVDAARIASQIAAALGAIHAKGLVHRDVKPSNILVTPDGFAKLSDFGIVALLGEPSGASLTRTNAVVGTPHYMSPEQVRGRDELSAASDVYSLGVVLYEMLAGKHPFDDATPSEAISAVLNEPLPPIRRYREDVPDVLAAVLDRCLARDRTQRFPDGGAARDVLEKARLRLETDALERGPETAEYRKRVTGTGFFYTEAARPRRTGLGSAVTALAGEVVAQIRDPNKRKRRQLAHLHRRAMAARRAYKEAEKHMEPLGDRRRYHEEKAAKSKEQAQKLIDEGHAEEAESAAEQEARHEKLALDYAHQVEQIGKKVQRLRDEYDRLRKEHTRDADELALLDAEARRAGKRVPSHADNPTRARAARFVQRCGCVLLVALLLLGICGLVLLAFSPKVERRAGRKPEVFVKTGTVRTDGLVLHYTFDEDEGGTVTDQSGRGNHGTAQGTKQTREPNGNGVCWFDGKDDLITVWTREQLNANVNTRNGAVSLWVAPENEGFVYAYISGDTDRLYLQRNRGRAHFGIGDSPYPTGKDYSTALRPGWNHIVAVWDADGVVRLFLNGVLDRTGKFGNPGFGFQGNRQFVVGKSYNPYPDYYRGKIDELMIFARSLSAKDVSRLYEKQGPRFPTTAVAREDGLILHYTFDKDQGASATDRSGSGFHGAVKGAKWARENGNGYMEFDGKDDHIMVGRPPALIRQTTEQFTMSARIYWAREDVLGNYIMGRGRNALNDMVMYVNHLGRHLECRIARPGTPEAVLQSKPGSIRAQQWYQVTTTFDGVYYALYLDGTFVSRFGWHMPIQDNGNNFVVGDRHTLDRPFPGRIDDVRVYNRALSAAEVARLYYGNPRTRFTIDSSDKITDNLTGVTFQRPKPGPPAYSESGPGYKTVRIDVRDKVVADGTKRNYVASIQFRSGADHAAVKNFFLEIDGVRHKDMLPEINWPNYWEGADREKDRHRVTGFITSVPPLKSFKTAHLTFEMSDDAYPGQIERHMRGAKGTSMYVGFGVVPVPAGVLARHAGARDPVKEGWKRDRAIFDPANPPAEGPVHGGKHPPAWRIDTLGNGPGEGESSDTVGYFFPLHPGAVNAALRHGWVLRAVVKVSAATPGRWSGRKIAPLAVQFGTEDRSYSIRFHTEGEDLIVSAAVPPRTSFDPAVSHRIPGGAGTSHAYELRDTDADGAADLHVDGARVIAGYRGGEIGSMRRFVYFGDPCSQSGAAAEGDASFATVEFTVGTGSDSRESR